MISVRKCLGVHDCDGLFHIFLNFQWFYLICYITVNIKAEHNTYFDTTLRLRSIGRILE